MNCLACNTELTRGQKKYCTTKCSAKHGRTGYHNSDRTCTTEGCERASKTKGMCATHYNQSIAHRYKRDATCDWCKETFKTEKRPERYKRSFCGLECRDNGLRKVWPTCELPTDHWARMYGTTCEWTPPKPAPRFVANQCNNCGTKFIELEYGTQSSYCSEACATRSSKRRRRAREYNAPGEYTLNQIVKQYIKQGSVCAYCKQPADGLPAPEHVMPLSRGGRNDMSNLVAACHSCNSQKGDLTLAEWQQHRKERGQPALDTRLVGPEYAHLVSTEPTKPAHRHECTA